VLVVVVCTPTATVVAPGDDELDAVLDVVVEADG
jgi:hypothetical protein